MGGTVEIQRLSEYEDGFNVPVVKNTRNAIDLPAFYDFSEERYRFIENGTRVRDPDADSTRFADQSKQFLLTPEAGDTIEFKTAEAPRYIVGNDAKASWAMKAIDGSGLQDASDSVTLFVEDAFEVEFDGAGDGEFRTIEGGATKKAKPFSIPVPLESPMRPEITFNWYGVGRSKIEIDYTDSGTQKTSDPVIITIDDDWLSDDPTGRIGYRLDVASSGVQFEAGSMAYIPQTDTTPTSRPKPHLFSSAELNQVAATGYTVVGAMRIDPDRDNVFTAISGVDVTGEQSVDVELFLKAVGESQTDADFLDPDDDGTDEGPAYPRSNSPQNSVIQWTPNVSTFPTRTYAVDGTAIPDGRNVGAATEGSSGVGSGVVKSGRGFSRIRPIYPDDVVLMIGHTPDADTAADVDVFVETDQDW